MKKQIIVFIMLLFVVEYSSAQIFCIPPIQPKYPELALRAGLTISFRVQFDIVGFVPQDYSISELDGAGDKDNGIVELFRPSIIEYLNRLFYLKDARGFILKLRYFIHPKNSINRGYVQKVAEDEIHIIELKPDVSIQRMDTTRPNPNIDSVTIHWTIQYKSGAERKSEILVQRLFNGAKDSIIILRNNYPELESDIYSDAKYHPKSEFLFYGQNAKYYFIRYRVARNIKDCGCGSVY